VKLAVFVVFLISAPCYAQEALTREQLVPIGPRQEIQLRLNAALDFGQIRQDRVSEHDASVLNRAYTASRANLPIIFRTDRLDNATLWSLSFPLEAFESFKTVYSDDGPITLNLVNDVTYASQDLAIKAAFFSRNQGGNEIEVFVRTFKDHQEVDMREIFYAPYTQPKKRVRFDRLSPSDDLVPPGHYWLWSELNGTAARQVEFRCGDDGRTKRTVDIPAP